MSDQDTHQTPDASGSANPDGLERLLRLAGPRRMVSDDRALRVRTAVHDAWRASVRARTIRRRAVVGAGALAAAAVLALAVVWRPRDAVRPPSPGGAAGRLLVATGAVTTGPGTPLRRGDALAIGTTMRTGAAALATVVLSAGGELRIDADTVVELRGERELIVERGAIYLDSGPAATGGSMRVHTALGVVRDIGTRFEVRVRDDELRVRVREGAVLYERGDDVRRGATAGSELVVSGAGSVETRPAASYGSEWGWVQRAAPPFLVEGSTLAAFLGWVSHEGGWTVQFVDAALEHTAATITLHGSIDGLMADEAVAVILPTCGLAHRTDAGRLIVFSASSEGVR